MFRVALVGIGDAGKHHARALEEVEAEGLISWSAICARDPERLSSFRRALRVHERVEDFAGLDALLDARVCDAVVLATPDGLHSVQIERAASRGLHVLVEKPLALGLPEGARAIACAREANVRLQVGYHLRHHAAHRLVAGRIGALVGKLRRVFVSWAWPDPATTGWRARGEGARFWSLAALGTHGIDLALMFAVAARQERVPATGWIEEVAAVLEPASGIDRAAEVSLRLEGGVLAHVSVSVSHRAATRLLVTGDLGEIEAIGTLGARGDGELFHRAPREAPRSLAFEPDNPYSAQLRELARLAPAGFVEEPALLANLDVLERIPGRKEP